MCLPLMEVGPVLSLDMGVYHSYSPNVYWYDDVERREKVFYALRGIGEGEELLYNYDGTNNIGEAYEF